MKATITRIIHIPQIIIKASNRNYPPQDILVSYYNKWTFVLLAIIMEDVGKR